MRCAWISTARAAGQSEFISGRAGWRPFGYGGCACGTCQCCTSATTTAATGAHTRTGTAIATTQRVIWTHADLQMSGGANTKFRGSVSDICYDQNITGFTTADWKVSVNIGCRTGWSITFDNNGRANYRFIKFVQNRSSAGRKCRSGHQGKIYHRKQTDDCIRQKQGDKKCRNQGFLIVQNSRKKSSVWIRHNIPPLDALAIGVIITFFTNRRNKNRGDKINGKMHLRYFLAFTTKKSNINTWEENLSQKSLSKTHPYVFNCLI